MKTLPGASETHMFDDLMQLDNQSLVTPGGKDQMDGLDADLINQNMADNQPTSPLIAFEDKDNNIQGIN